MKNVLTYWKLTEILKQQPLPKASLNTLEQIQNQIEIANKYTNKEHYKIVYHSIIKISDLFKMVADKLKVNLSEDELLLIKDTDYTYLAYSYFNPVDNIHIKNIDGQDGEAIYINPIFHFLSNGNSLDKTISESNQEFNSYFKEINKQQAHYLPDTSALIEYAKKYSKAKNIFDSCFLPGAKIYISSVVLKELDGLKNSTHEKTATAARKVSNDLLKATESKQYKIKLGTHNYSKNEQGDILDSKNDEVIVNYASAIARKNPDDYVYLWTNDINQSIYTRLKIIKNLFPVKFLQRDNTINSFANARLIPELSLDITSLLLDSFKLTSYIDMFSKIPYAEIIENPDTKEALMESFFLNTFDKEPTLNAIEYFKNNQMIDASDKNTLHKLNNPLLIPNARWASSYSLNFSQQNAINSYLSEYNTKNSIKSINGPAGSGKTTLVKDVIAEVLLRKAEVMIMNNFSVINNKQEFNQELLNKYDILITSSNNNAVENISRVLPLAKEFDFNLIDKAPEDFLLYNIINEYERNEEEVYYPVSFPLGNSSNMGAAFSYIKHIRDHEMLDGAIELAKAQNKLLLISLAKQEKRLNTIKNLNMAKFKSIRN